MFRSTGETMVRLKSLDLKIKFKIYYDSIEPIVKYKNNSTDEVIFTVRDLQHEETFTFQNFSHLDPCQKIQCSLEYDGRIVDLYSLSQFQMKDNKYVDNIVLNNCIDVHFNGELTLKFSKKWFKHNILSGANIGDGYCNWDEVNFSKQQIFCVGDSFTFGTGTDKNHTWPFLLNPQSYNFGTEGLSHDGCLKNVQFILNKSKDVKQIICLLPWSSRRLFEFDFLGTECCIPVSYNSQFTLPKKFRSNIKKIKDNIVNDDGKDHWVKCCRKIIKECEKKGVQIWVSTWAKSLHKYIPNKNRLPLFPKMNTFNERASDNEHPHKKHYELFVKSIRPYIDKKQF